MTLGKTSDTGKDNYFFTYLFYRLFDLDRLMAYPITSYDYDFNLDLNQQYVPMDGWLMRPINRERIFTFLATL